MILDELKIRLGLDADTFKVKDFVHSIGEVPVTVAAAISSLAGMSMGFLDLTRDTLSLSNNLSMFRAETGLSTQELQRWQAVAKQVGMSNETVTQSILGINNALAQIRLGHGEALLPLGRLGVDARGKNAFQILEEIGKNSQKMSPNVATALMGQLGISPEMMRIFSLGPGQFSKMASVAPLINEEEMRSMQNLQAALAHFSMTIEKEFVPVLKEIEPYLSTMAELMGALFGKVAKPAVNVLGSDLKMLNDVRKTDPAAFSRDMAMLIWTIGRAITPKAMDVTVNSTNNITSTADPEEVARIANEHHKRSLTTAAKQFDNGGY